MQKVVQAKTGWSPWTNYGSQTMAHSLAESWEGNRFDSQKWSCWADGDPPVPLPVTLPLMLNIPCRKLPLSAKMPLVIKKRAVTLSVTLKVAPWHSAV